MPAAPVTHRSRSWITGRSSAGSRTIVSHTAALASPINLWEAAMRQAGAIPVRNLDELLDLAVSFHFLPPIKGTRVGIIGGGGGRAVLNADECEEIGLNVIPLPPEIDQEVRNKDPFMWNWLGNPVDLSITRGSFIDPEYMLTMMAENPNFDFLIGYVSEDYPFTKDVFISSVENEVREYITVSKKRSKPIVVVLGDRSLGIEDMNDWRWRLFAETRTSLINANIPFYPTIGQAAKAVRALVAYYCRRDQELQQMHERGLLTK